MAEEEIAILITAEDRATKGFQDATTSLLALGNAAAAVDRITSAYTNQQIRLENASERLANTQDRLADAQRKLNKLQSSGTATSEELADAQRDVERATRSLTISENNLARVQNQVIGTYINMGIQAVTLVGSFNQLKKSLELLKLESLAFMATPIGAALVALAAIVGIATIAINEQKNKQEELKKVSEEYISVQEEMNSKWKEAHNETQLYADAINNVRSAKLGLINKKSVDELTTIAKLKEQEYELQKARNSGENETLLGIREKEIAQTQSDLSIFESQRASLAAANELFQAQKEQEKGIRTEVENFWGQSYTNQVQILKDADKEIEEEVGRNVKAMMDEYDKLVGKLNDVIQKQKEIEQRTFGNMEGKLSKGNVDYRPSSVFKMNDGMITKDGKVIKLNPQDDIIASKNGFGGGGISIIIEGNVYGTDPDEMASAFYDKLRKKITT